MGRDEAFWQNQAWRENRFRSPDLRHDLDCRRENEERHRQEDEQHRRFLVDQEAARYVERLRLEQEDLSRRAAADMVRSGAPSVPIVQDPPSAPSQLPSQDIPQGPTQPDGELNEAFDGKVTPCPLVSSALCDEISGYFTSSITSVQSKSISAEFPLSFEEGGFSLKPPKMNNYLLRRAKSKSMLKEVQIKGEALTKIQLKIMDIAPPPLIELAARMREFSDEQARSASPIEARIRRTVEASLQQWGWAYANITRLRREAFIKKVEPHFEFLLDEKSAFAEGKEARELLFTD